MRTVSILVLLTACSQAPSETSVNAQEPEPDTETSEALAPDPASVLPEPVPVDCGPLSTELVEQTGVLVRAIANSERVPDSAAAQKLLREFVAGFDGLNTSKVPFLPMMASKTDVRDKLLELAASIDSPAAVEEWRQKSGNRIRVALQFYLSQTGCGGRR